VRPDPLINSPITGTSLREELLQQWYNFDVPEPYPDFGSSGSGAVAWDTRSPRNIRPPTIRPDKMYLLMEIDRTKSKADLREQFEDAIRMHVSRKEHIGKADSVIYKLKCLATVRLTRSFGGFETGYNLGKKMVKGRDKELWENWGVYKSRLEHGEALIMKFNEAVSRFIRPSMTSQGVYQVKKRELELPPQNFEGIMEFEADPGFENSLSPSSTNMSGKPTSLKPARNRLNEHRTKQFAP